jgi:hypothetical protein
MHIIPGDLPAVWRERAETLRTYGDPNSARLWDIAAVELERAMEVFGQQTLSLTEAARESGFTADHLGALVKRGKIPNGGRTGAPRIRRIDLPQKRWADQDAHRVRSLSIENMSVALPTHSRRSDEEEEAALVRPAH